MARNARGTKAAAEGRRINVAPPSQVARDLEELVPRGERSRFIVEATEEALRRTKLLRAIERSAGC